MSSITGTSSTTTAAASSTNSTANALTQQTSLTESDFLQLLVAQLQNQDPLNPVSATDFTTQLAEFSSLEQLTGINSQLQTLTSNLQSSSNSQLVGLIGSTVTANGDSFTSDGTSQTLSYTLPSSIVSGAVNIYNSSGTLVSTVPLGNQQAGTNTATWNANGNTGNFTYTVTGTDSSGNAVTANTQISGQVEGIYYQNNTPYLVVNGQQVAFSDIVTVQ